MKEISEAPPRKLTSQEKEALVAFFDVLIEMDFEYQRNNKESEDTANDLLDTKNSIPLAR